jgi:cysteine synthase
MNGHVDIFVSGFGSGGTLMGTGKYLKERNPNIMIVAVEPKNASALLGHELTSQNRRHWRWACSLHCGYKPY